jgi:transcriptional regulator with XRE-family HTH domain
VGHASPQPLGVRQKLRKQLGSFLRKSRGDLTFAQFEKKMGISGSTLHRIELGQQNVTLDTLEAIMDRLKVSMSDIFGSSTK